MSTPEVHLTPQTVNDVYQLRAILTGVVGLLQNPMRHEAVASARGAAMEASAIAERVVTHIDALAAIRLEQERAERAHREQQAKITGALCTSQGGR
jgi:hypothetical protein